MTDPIEFELEYLSACPVCGGEKIAPAFTSPWRGQTITYCVCVDCGQLFLNPRMTDEQTTAYYSGVYRDITEGAENGGVSQGNLYSQFKRASLQWAMMGRYLEDTKSHLEIGSSAGYLLDEVKAPLTVGVEADIRYHNLPISSLYNCVKDIADVERQPFELISLSHVLEHFNHPVEYLSNLADNYAGPNTRFLIEVPNTDYQAVATLSHPLAFGAATLQRLFARIGFRSQAVFYHGLGKPFPVYLLTLFERA